MAIVTTKTAARTLNVSEKTVRAMERRGELPAERTEGGVRLFRSEDVDRLKAERERKRVA